MQIKDEVLAELMAEHIALKKMYGPPLDCKRKLSLKEMVRVNVSGLWVERAPGHDEYPRVPSLIAVAIL